MKKWYFVNSIAADRFFPCCTLSNFLVVVVVVQNWGDFHACMHSTKPCIFLQKCTKFSRGSHRENPLDTSHRVHTNFCTNWITGFLYVHFILHNIYSKCIHTQKFMRTVMHVYKWKEKKLKILHCHAKIHKHLHFIAEDYEVHAAPFATG